MESIFHVGNTGYTFREILGQTLIRSAFYLAAQNNIRILYFYLDARCVQIRIVAQLIADDFLNPFIRSLTVSWSFPR